MKELLQNQPSQTIFLGDDINDLTVIPAVRMFVSPANAHPACFKKASWIGTCKGGEGFLREFTDLFLLSLNIDPYKEFRNSASWLAIKYLTYINLFLRNKLFIR